MMTARTVTTTAVACIAAVGIAASCSGGVAPPSNGPVPGPGSPHRTSAQLDSEAIHLVVGDTLDLGDLFSSESRRWSFSSTDASTAPVTPTGLLRAVSPGSALIVATGPYPLGVRDSARVYVMPRREAINRMVSEVCPNEDERSIAISQPYDSLPIIHEYHDCQRLIRGGQYGGVVGIFAHRNVDIYQHRDSFANGRLAAIIVDFVTKQQLMPYTPLGITPGTNCLVIKSDSGGGWRAAIVGQSPALSLALRRYLPCGNNLTWADVPQSARALLVVKTQTDGYDLRGRRIVPPVARWDWDERNRLNYIGIKCDSVTWCEIGPPDFSPSEPVRIANQPLYKGYYDEQYLADSTGRQVTSIFGTITPGTNARDTSDMRPLPGAKFHLSHLRIAERGNGPTAAYRYYSRKFVVADTPTIPTFRQTSVADLRIIPIKASTTYSLGGLTAAGVPTTSGPWLGMFSVYAGESNGTWLGPQGVAFRSHPSSVVKVPTVRWRWKFNDEGAWGFCRPNGCCESFYAEM
jgi:hypothetical protein